MNVNALKRQLALKNQSSTLFVISASFILCVQLSTT